MFNVFEFEKRKTDQKKRQIDEIKRKKNLSKQKLKNEEMGNNYRRRVGTFIKHMIMEPKIQEDGFTEKLNTQ